MRIHTYIHLYKKHSQICIPTSHTHTHTHRHTDRHTHIHMDRHTHAKRENMFVVHFPKIKMCVPCSSQTPAMSSPANELSSMHTPAMSSPVCILQLQLCAPQLCESSAHSA